MVRCGLLNIPKIGLKGLSLGASIATPVYGAMEARLQGIQKLPKEGGKTNNSK